ncbi:HXXEE domain-containing protein [Isoptericola sp. NPDC055881]
MGLIRRHWYDFGLVIALAILAVQAIAAPFEGVQLILLLNLVVLLLHEVEEYRLPGGEPWILNEVVNAKGDRPERYPLNQNGAAIGNILFWVFFAVPVFFPDQIWLAIVPILMGCVGQLVVHGVQTNLKLKTWYNPGLATVVFGFIPVGIWYFVTVYSAGGIAWTQWLLGLAYGLPVMIFLFVVLGFGILADKNSPYPFTRDEMSRWGREKRLLHAGITPRPLPGGEQARV